MESTSDDLIQPLVFARMPSRAAAVYLNDPAVRLLVEFFEKKGLLALKEEDRLETWYDDWLEYQALHRIYAGLLSPREFSSAGAQLNLLRLTRFLEVFAYFSPAHGYSLQVTFLGLFSVLAGRNEALKREAVATLEAGGLFAFGVSERGHGSDLFANEFSIREAEPGRFVAHGEKYYIGNANVAAMISILARKESARAATRAGGPSRRAPLAFFVLRPATSKAYGQVSKIRTLGVRAAFVGEFRVEGHEFPQTDLIAEGRDAWDTFWATVTLGKFFLGFGSIGICEHALEEASEHLRKRVLFGSSVAHMPHIRLAMARAYARLTAMKLYAYRALDYVHAASESDRRYLLFCAVQKARVSTEGVKVLSLLSECVGAKGFESDTYLEMALRDVQLIPRLEGSTHINYATTAQFIPAYFAGVNQGMADPQSLIAQGVGEENPYLMQARAGDVGSIPFPPIARAYAALKPVQNVRRFIRQVRGFSRFVQSEQLKSASSDAAFSLALGECFAIIVYGQLIAENAVQLHVSREVVGVIFHLLIEDLNSNALKLAGFPELPRTSQAMLRRLITMPKTTRTDWNFVSERMSSSL